MKEVGIRQKTGSWKILRWVFSALLASSAFLFIGCGSLGAGSGADRISENTSLTREILGRSLAQGRKYLVNIQRPEGNFYYERNFITGKVTQNDSAVRQAGALWSLALLHLDQPGDDTREAIERGLGYFEKHSRLTEDGRRFIVYPGAAGSTGAVALVTLSLIDFIRAEPDHANAEKYRRQIDQYIKMLLSLRRADGRFYGGYGRYTGRPKGRPSPFFDGETLLALCKAINYLGREGLQSMLMKSAETMYQTYFVNAAAENNRLIPTQFFQWGAMSFFEMDKEPWPERDKTALRAFDIARWYVEETRNHPPDGNNSAAYEGLISAWELARRRRRTDIQSILGEQIERGMLQLTSMQVDGPLPNEFLQRHPARDAIASGGVMLDDKNPDLRIDVAQHQMHAAVMARRFIYNSE